MSISNITKFLSNATSAGATYVDNMIEQKRQADFNDKMSAKPRKDFNNQIMTDNEYEKAVCELDNMYDKYGINKQDEESIKNKEILIKEFFIPNLKEETKEHQKNNVLDKKDVYNNLKPISVKQQQVDKNSPTYEEDKKNFQSLSKFYSATKRGDTLLVMLNTLTDDESRLNCTELRKRELDKRYGMFYCHENSRIPTKPGAILSELTKLYNDAVRAGIKTIKFYLNGHGTEKGKWVIGFPLDEFKRSLQFFDGRYDNMNVVFIKDACYDGGKTLFEDIVKYFSIKNPNIIVISQSHNSNKTVHDKTMRCCSFSHKTFNYYLWKNGVKRRISKDEKNQILGGSYILNEKYKENTFQETTKEIIKILDGAKNYLSQASILPSSAIKKNTTILENSLKRIISFVNDKVEDGWVFDKDIKRLVKDVNKISKNLTERYFPELTKKISNYTGDGKTNYTHDNKTNDKGQNESLLSRFFVIATSLGAAMFGAAYGLSGRCRRNSQKNINVGNNVNANLVNTNSRRRRGRSSHT